MNDMKKSTWGNQFTPSSKLDQSKITAIKLSDLANCSEHSSMHYCCEVSDLGMPCGKWPEFLSVKGLGNGQHYYPIHADKDRVIYLQMAGCVRITLFND